MIKELKEIRRQNQLKNNNKFRYDDEGRVIIDLHVKDDNNFLSPYSTEENSTISDGVSDFIAHSLLEVNAKERIHFNIYSNSIDEKEKKEYTSAIHSQYASEYKQTVYEKKRLLIISAIMFMIAVLTLTVMILLEVSGVGNAIITEIIDIVSWVFMWEAVDVFFFRRTALKHKEYRCLCLCESIIEYFPYIND